MLLEELIAKWAPEKIYTFVLSNMKDKKSPTLNISGNGFCMSSVLNRTHAVLFN